MWHAGVCVEMMQHHSLQDVNFAAHKHGSFCTADWIGQQQPAELVGPSQSKLASAHSNPPQPAAHAQLSPTPAASTRASHSPAAARIVAEIRNQRSSKHLENVQAPLALGIARTQTDPHTNGSMHPTPAQHNGHLRAPPAAGTVPSSAQPYHAPTQRETPAQTVQVHPAGSMRTSPSFSNTAASSLEKSSTPPHASAIAHSISASVHNAPATQHPSSSPQPPQFSAIKTSASPSSPRPLAQGQQTQPPALGTKVAASATHASSSASPTEHTSRRQARPPRSRQGTTAQDAQAQDQAYPPISTVLEQLRNGNAPPHDPSKATHLPDAAAIPSAGVSPTPPVPNPPPAAAVGAYTVILKQHNHADPVQGHRQQHPVHAEGVLAAPTQPVASVQQAISASQVADFKAEKQELLAERPSHLAPDTVPLQCVVPSQLPAGVSAPQQHSLSDVCNTAVQGSAPGEQGDSSLTQVTQKHADNVHPVQARQHAGTGDVCSSACSSSHVAAEDAQHNEGSSRSQGAAALYEAGRKLNSGSRSGTKATIPALPPVAEGTEPVRVGNGTESILVSVLTSSVEKLQRLPAVQRPDAPQHHQRRTVEDSEASERAYSINCLYGTLCNTLHSLDTLSCKYILCQAENQYAESTWQRRSEGEGSGSPATVPTIGDQTHSVAFPPRSVGTPEHSLNVAAHDISLQHKVESRCTLPDWSVSVDVQNGAGAHAQVPAERQQRSVKVRPVSTACIFLSSGGFAIHDVFRCPHRSLCIFASRPRGECSWM